MKNILNVLRWLFYSYFLVGFLLFMLVKYNMVTLKNSFFHFAYEVLAFVAYALGGLFSAFKGNINSFSLLQDLILLVIAITALFLICEVIWTFIYGIFARKKS